MDTSRRCDRCGAQSYVKVVLFSGELEFCGHHFEDNRVALSENPGVFGIEDDRKELTKVR